uniref:Tetraspanin n=1 Tax=Leptobrachium leishanense TaxID=445787 RepID=A0A8C5LS58_9ANUR
MWSNLHTIKCCLTIISLMYWVVGAGLAYIAYKLFHTYQEYTELLSYNYIAVLASLLIIISVTMFIIGVTGLGAAIKEYTFNWKCFMGLAFIMVCTGIIGLIVGLYYKDKLNPHLEGNMSKLFQEYDGESAQSSTVDSIQERLQCCGLKNYTYWENSTWHIQHNNSVPRSCCKNNATTCTGSLDHLEQINTRGCESDFEGEINILLRIAMCTVLGSGSAAIFVIIIVIVLHVRNKRNGYERL